MPNLDVHQLNEIYTEAEGTDFELFSEQRSNVQLSVGSHYIQRSSRFWSRIRDTRQLQQRENIRLTKNHLSKIVKTYINAINNHSPGVTIMPKNDTELQDQKAAELHGAVWEDVKHRHKFREQKLNWIKDFVEIGELAVKIFWDPNKGEFLGYEAKMIKDPMTGEMVPEVDPMTGEMVPSSKAVFTGDFVFDRIWGFDLLRDPAAKTMSGSRYLIYRKMVDIPTLKKMIGPDEKKLAMVHETGRDTFQVFEGTNGGYRRVKNMAQVREYYYRPSGDYPKGYFYITTESGILWEGELPFGIFPITFVGFDEASTSPRYRSIIKQLRPYQAEVNRSASKIAEHQITLGDDKILIQAGTKIASGGILPGVRAISYQGMPPTHLPGRSGEQYLAYMQSQISEMYGIANVAEEVEEKQRQIDPYTMLFKSMREKKKFSIYAEKFENFMTELCEKTLVYAKNYYKPEMLVPAVGKREVINIPEFKNMDDLGHQIKVEPQSDDIESKLGKQLVMNHILQFVGPQMEPDQTGLIMRAMPFTNNEKIFESFTQDYDNSVNDILALDRGQYREPRKYDNHKFIIKALVNRMKQSDFENLDPQIQQLYAQKVQQHEEFETMNLQEIQKAQSGFIPSGGFLVACDFYVKDPEKPSRQRRARIPSEAVKWLVDKLESQGSNLKDLENLQQGALVDIAQQFNQGQPQQQQQIPAGAGQAPGGPVDTGSQGVY